MPSKQKKITKLLPIIITLIKALSRMIILGFMKKIMMGLILLSSLACLAGEVSGTAKLLFTPNQSTGEIELADPIAKAIYNELSSEEFKVGNITSKHGDLVNCYKSKNNKNKDFFYCRVVVKFGNY